MYYLKIQIRKSTAAFIFSLCLLLPLKLTRQDTLRTYGPRIGLDIVRFAKLLAEPTEIGAEASLDLEVYKNIYAVMEAGYNSISIEEESFTYILNGAYTRIGMDYNLLPVKDRSVHHAIFLGGRYGISRFKHEADNIVSPNSYWGDFSLDQYVNSSFGQWVELTGGMKTELLKNFFLGWTVRYKILLSKGNDQVMDPYSIPGYGRGNTNRGFGISYSVLYKFPVIKR